LIFGLSANNFDGGGINIKRGGTWQKIDFIELEK